MDDMKDMDESPEPVEQSLASLGRDFLTKAGSHELSRRTMIKASVVAGGLVWSAPVLLTGKAAAQTTIPCCPEGTAVSVNISEQNGVNCGQRQCLDNLGLDFGCPDDLVNCLGDQDFVVADFVSGGQDTATIVLAPGVSLIVAAVKAGDSCYATQCPCFAKGPRTPPNTPPATGGCPNTCYHHQNNNPCNFGNNDTPLPPAPGGRNRVWVTAGPGPGETTIHVNTQPDGQLNQVEMSLCVAPEITALCP